MRLKVHGSSWLTDAQLEQLSSPLLVSTPAPSSQTVPGSQLDINNFLDSPSLPLDFGVDAHAIRAS